MGNENIPPLEKNTIISVQKNEKATEGCCGGAPAVNTDACCKLDEDKKAEGKTGCGCNSPEVRTSASSCCM